MSDFDQRLCDEKHKNANNERDVLFKRVLRVEQQLNGNGNTGLCSKVDALWTWYQRQSATQAGLLDWGFRVVIMLVLGYIATRIGIK